MTFEYLQRVIVDGELSIDNIGDCTIQSRNDLGEEWYLIIRTEMGWSEVIEYGPATPDFDLLPRSVSQKYDRFEYNVGKITRIIDSFLNNPKRLITQASVVNIEDIRQFMVNPLEKIQTETED